MDPATAASAVSALKLTEKVFEIKAVDEQANSLLETVNEINGQLDAAKSLRGQKDSLLSTVEKTLIDRTFESTERALGEVAKLVEPCRVAMKSSKGDLEFGMRLMYVLRDSPRILVSLGQLQIASQRLQTALHILCSREVQVNQLPTYQESQFFTQTRAKNMLRKANGDSAIQQRPRIDKAALDSLAEDDDEVGDLIDFTPDTSSPQSMPDELFFDAQPFLDAQPTTRKHASSVGSYIPYRPSQVNASLPETTAPPARPARPASLPEVQPRPPQPLSRNSTPIPETSWNMAFDPTWRVSTAAVAAEISASSRKSPSPLSPGSGAPRSSSGRENAAVTPYPSEQSIKPPVAPKPEALRGANASPEVLPAHLPLGEPLKPDSPPSVNTGSAVPTAQLPIAEPRKKKDWEFLPSQVLRAANLPTFVFTCASPELAPDPLNFKFQNMVKLEEYQDTPEDVSSVQVDLVPEPGLGKTSAKPLPESEFPELVTESTMPRPALSPAGLQRAPRNRTPEPVTLVTEVSVDMMTRARSIREARLLNKQMTAPNRAGHAAGRASHAPGRANRALERASPAPERASPAPDRANHAPEVVSRRQSMHAPELVAPSRQSMPSPELVAPSRQSTPAMLPSGRRLSASSTVSSLDVAPSVTTNSGVSSRQSSLSGRARSQRWRELQFERSQQLPKTK